MTNSRNQHAAINIEIETVKKKWPRLIIHGSRPIHQKNSVYSDLNKIKI